MKEIDQEISNKIDSLFSFDDEAFDKVNPVDKGLGFHHKKMNLEDSRSKLKNLSQKPSGIPLPNIGEVKEVEMPKTLSHQGLNRAVEKEFDLNILNNVERDKNESSPEEVVYQPSTVEKVAFAWLVDLFIIFTFIGGAVFFIINFSGVNVGSPLELILRRDFIIFLSAFFGIFYLIYFSVLEMLGTPGRMIFGTKLISTRESGSLHSWQTVVRSLVILISPFLLLIPLYFGWHNSLSETRSVEDKW
tara:strand:+ start:2318 stop:3055 length:738 start_codon:yes stop_codon:yes gene_type:complete